MGIDIDGRGRWKMADRLYEPAARGRHVSIAVGGKMYIWGESSRHSGELASNVVEQFDPYLEVWNQLPTVRTPHPTLDSAAYTSFGGRIYVYGLGLNHLDLRTLTWSQVCPAGTGGPMRKIACGMVHFNHDKLAVIGGYGFPSGPTQPGSTFIRDTRATDGRGLTNEIHVFDISQGSQL